jgi:hypothetical protein
MRPRALLIAPLLAGALAGVACKGDGKKAPPADPVQPGSPPATDAAVEEPPAALDETAVRAAVAAWVAAQNRGDFAAYQQLYAGTMEGVKRVGARTWRFDRAGWMTDRQRMFGRPMKVAADEIAVSIAGPMATVELVQTFEQGKFRDQGPKQIVLVAAPGGPRIAREEMMASTPTTPTTRVESEAGLRFVVQIDARPHLVIGPAESAWAAGAARGPFASDKAQYMALRDATGAPAVAQAWRGRTVTLYGAAGSCTATIGELAVAGGGTPHFSVESRWAGSPESDRPGKPMSQAQRAREVLALSDLRLVGALQVPAGCDPIYAIGGTAPTTFPRAASVDDATRDKALAAFRALPAYAALQKEFETTYDGKGPWTASPAVTVYASDERTFVSVEAEEGEGCGGWNGALWALFELEGGALALVNDPGASRYSPAAMLDADGDGTVEIIGQASTLTGGYWHVAMTPGEPTVKAEIEFPFTDCGC